MICELDQVKWKQELPVRNDYEITRAQGIHIHLRENFGHLLYNLQDEGELCQSHPCLRWPRGTEKSSELCKFDNFITEENTKY